MKTTTAADVIHTVGCPTCGQYAGNPCRSPWTSLTHMARAALHEQGELLLAEWDTNLLVAELIDAGR